MPGKFKKVGLAITGANRLQNQVQDPENRDKGRPFYETYANVQTPQTSAPPGAFEDPGAAGQERPYGHAAYGQYPAQTQAAYGPTSHNSPPTTYYNSNNPYSSAPSNVNPISAISGPQYGNGSYHQQHSPQEYPPQQNLPSPADDPLYPGSSGSAHDGWSRQFDGSATSQNTYPQPVQQSHQRLDHNMNPGSGHASMNQSGYEFNQGISNGFNQNSHYHHGPDPVGQQFQSHQTHPNNTNSYEPSSSNFGRRQTTQFAGHQQPQYSPPPDMSLSRGNTISDFHDVVNSAGAVARRQQHEAGRYNPAYNQFERR